MEGAKRGALRELEEETGIKVGVERLAGLKMLYEDEEGGKFITHEYKNRCVGSEASTGEVVSYVGRRQVAFAVASLQPLFAPRLASPPQLSLTLFPFSLPPIPGSSSPFP